METAVKKAPARAAARGSFVRVGIPSKRLVTTDTTPMEYTVEIINFPPNFHHPTIRMGIFKANTHVPVPTPVTAFNKIEIPVIPPGARSLGSRKKAMLHAKRMEKTVMAKYFFTKKPPKNFFLVFPITVLLFYFFINKELPVISSGCSIPINSIKVGTISARHPPSFNP